MQNALLVSCCISLLCPCIGIFVVLRRCAMIGDTMAHASLAGITLGLLCRQNPILGAFCFTSLCGALIEFLRRYFPHHLDLILTVILSLSTGTAITLISSGKLHANANAFLFGSILTVNQSDIICILALTITAVLTLIFLYHQLLYIAYDEETAKLAGVHTGIINYIFAILMAAAVSISIKIVGVLVLSAMIALPVAAALQLEKGFRPTLLFSIGFSLLTMLLGLIGSFYVKVAPGGFISLMAVFLLLLMLFLKKLRLIWRRRRQPLDFAPGSAYDKNNGYDEGKDDCFERNTLAGRHQAHQAARRDLAGPVWRQASSYRRRYRGQSRRF
jgi:zinc transport system permease protein